MKEPIKEKLFENDIAFFVDKIFVKIYFNKHQKLNDILDFSKEYEIEDDKIEVSQEEEEIIKSKSDSDSSSGDEVFSNDDLERDEVFSDDDLERDEDMNFEEFLLQKKFEKEQIEKKI